ncbi:MAG: adenosylcobinamide amidohydrolase [Spirochaetes bacterium]|nr:adenosylcobinamide amidohydrolase [Spirochaetota bacterium]
MLYQTELADTQLFLTDQCFYLAFKKKKQILSSAILNGGLKSGKQMINLKVEENFQGKKKKFSHPADTIAHHCTQLRLTGTTIGMMTSASMQSFQQATITQKGITVVCFLTSGLSNARRAGDPADWPYFSATDLSPGTINIILGTNAHLSSAALVEAIMIITETKVAVLNELAITSPISDKLATGTGTDSTAIFHGNGLDISYCGKHVLLGEMIAKCTAKALKASLEWYQKR